MPDKKDYASGTWVRERRFDNGGSVLKVSIKWDRFSEWAATRLDDQGFLRLQITDRKEPDERGYTHTVSRDTWTPTGTTRPTPARTTTPLPGHEIF